ncbi:MAG TPA: hypothetical protein VL598_08170 [Trinickia sp.]|uniref:hypothetical protein n=1 Tax=Trinickia sp. TaxID=2571163 RepID=UPI002D1661BF|nr:hypothetical protein [Trinickia sp.]HTI17625.1 hypothetical protein [Trinickia sp.]
MAHKVFLFSLLACLSAPGWAADLPNPSLTPGAVNGAVTQANIEQTICVRGYTKGIRPPAHYTNRLKKEQLAEYGYPDVNPKHYEEDHLIPLEIGGNPTDPRNLWPEPRLSQYSAKVKDALENRLHRLVCSGQVPLLQAQEEIATNWITAYKKYVNR